MTTYEVVRIPRALTWTWGVLATYGDGAQGLCNPLYRAEADALAEAERLAAPAGRGGGSAT